MKFGLGFGFFPRPPRTLCQFDTVDTQYWYGVSGTIDITVASGVSWELTINGETADTGVGTGSSQSASFTPNHAMVASASTVRLVAGSNVVFAASSVWSPLLLNTKPDIWMVADAASSVSSVPNYGTVSGDFAPGGTGTAPTLDGTINGHQAVRFTDGGQALLGPVNARTGDFSHTIAVLAQWGSNTGYRGLAGIGSGGAAGTSSSGLGRNNTPVLWFGGRNDTTCYAAGQTPDTGNPHVYVKRRDGTLNYGLLDGENLSIYDAGGVTYVIDGGYYVVGDYDAYNNGGDLLACGADVLDVVVVPSALSTSDQLLLTKYMAARGGVTLP